MVTCTRSLGARHVPRLPGWNIVWQRDTTTPALITRAYLAAVSGDTAPAGRLLTELRARSTTRLGAHGSTPEFIEACIAARSGRWSDVVGLIARVSSSRVIWSRGGKELVFVAGDGFTIMAADVTTSPAFHAGAPRKLFKLRQDFLGMDITPDGQRVLVVAPAGQGKASTITVEQNWTAGLKKP